MGVVVEFRCCKCAGMKSHRVDFTGVSLHGEDGSEGIVGGIGFHNERFVGDPMGKDGCRGEGGLKSLKGCSSGI